MRRTARLFTQAGSLYGRYVRLDPSSALTAYPTPRPVPAHIPRPAYVPANFFSAGWGDHEEVSIPAPPSQEEGRMRSASDMAGVKRAGALAASALRYASTLVKPGVTTDEIDEAVHAWIVRHGAYPSPLGYSSFPRGLTTSINNVIAHGIPDGRPLEPDDIVNIDITVFLEGYHGDTSATFCLPDTDDQGRHLVEATREALQRGIKACGPGMPLSGIGQAISAFAANEGYSVNEQFSGHGIGRVFHSRPFILHHQNRERGTMAVGDCFTIEPALVQGHNSRGDMWDDGWTMSTESGARSAQFEHQVIITEDGVDVLTT